MRAHHADLNVYPVKMSAVRRVPALAALLAGGIYLATPAGASTFPAPGAYQTITPEDDQWTFSDSNGDGSVTIDFTANPYKFYLRYQLSEENIALCQPNSLNETLDLFNGSKKVLHDKHIGVACNYVHHLTFTKGNRSNYTMKIRDVFKVSVGGRTGTATLDAQANFKSSVGQP